MFSNREVTPLGNEITKLKQLLLRMASLAEEMVQKSVRSLVERDDDLARAVVSEDERLDQLEIEIDEASICLLTKAPLAGQLRLITVILKLTRDLERTGDESTTIARRALALGKEPPLKSYASILRMMELATAMLSGALDAFVHGDTVRARLIIQQDKQVDVLNRQLQGELTDSMVVDPSSVIRCLHLMTISKALERIGDHAKNIAEEAVYLYEAQDIRHQGKPTLK
ncbi:MAG: phosphate signaling complex protein PhoU [Pedosphaera sp.]|nr:phosphate signaling complex protein PhoU [Pedosphaera sp.]